MKLPYPVLLAAVLTISACTQETQTPAPPLAHEAGQRPVHPPAPPAVAADRDEALARVERRTNPSAKRDHAGHRAVQLGGQATGTRLLAPGASVAPPAPGLPASRPEVDRETYAKLDANGIVRVAEQPVSTLSIDVDTAAYANVRRMLNEGRLPPEHAVRVEEMINYFDYDDPRPTTRDAPFAVTTELAHTPWNPATRLLRVALNAWDIDEAALPPANLVFLIDVSGSMRSQDKLPLLKRSLALLTRRLDAADRVSLVVYAGAAGVVLEPTPGDQRARIHQALDELSAGGSTHGSAGIRLAYAKAREAFIDGGINRVILATDGDFNVGTVDHDALLDLVEREREAGIALTTLGFGRGNINDHLMEQLADHGNGNYGYIDSLMEAQKVLVEQIGGTLYTVAADVKLQVEFNPARVAEYRLIGYENRLLQREDFNNDRVDAGELGAGHSVVALYEIAETGSRGTRIDPLRYTVDAPAQATVGAHAAEYAFVRLRYKPRGSDVSRLLTQPVAADLPGASPSESLRFAAAVAAFGQRLRGAEHLGDFGYRDILALAREARGRDANGHRADFIRMVALAQSLSHNGRVAANGSKDGDDG